MPDPAPVTETAPTCWCGQPARLAIAVLDDPPSHLVTNACTAHAAEACADALDIVRGLT